MSINPGAKYRRAEDQIIRAGFLAGKSDHEIAVDLISSGFPRAHGSVAGRRLLLGMSRPRGFQSRMCEPKDAVETAPHVPKRDLERHRAMKADGAFQAAMRAAHPDLAGGFRDTVPSRSVPFRALPRPLFSSKGIVA